MKFKTTLINLGAALIFEKRLWNDVKMFVQAAVSTDDPMLSKEENNKRKHQNVYNKLVIVFGTIGETLLDGAIKIAVLWLNSQGQTQE